jgi:hypothetical protein
MPTIKQPCGRMTKALTTPYAVGDRVRLIADLWKHNEGPVPYVGDVGTIHEISISDPDDGDVTFLMFEVRWESFGDDMPVGEEEITPAADTKADAWLRRQLDALTEARS